MSNVELAAKTAHAVNRAYCIGLGDNSQLAWKFAAEWQRDLVIAGVQFLIDNPDAPPSAHHDSWLEEKRRTGWSYAPVKDSAKKEHPCFVPYDELPIAQQIKGTLFASVVRGILAS